MINKKIERLKERIRHLNAVCGNFVTENDFQVAWDLVLEIEKSLLNVSPAVAKRLKLCVDTVNDYGRFHEGQDGYQGMKELTAFIDSFQPDPPPPLKFEAPPKPHPDLKHLYRDRRRNYQWGFFVSGTSTLISYPGEIHAYGDWYEVDPITGEDLKA